MSETINLDVDGIKTWRSIITLVVFVLTNLAVLFPFHVPVYVPRSLVQGVDYTLRRLRVIAPSRYPQKGLRSSQDCSTLDAERRHWHGAKYFTRLRIPLNFMTAPLIADLFLLAILAIGREEVYDGTIGSNNIQPIDIMAFFLTLAYIAISIDASGLIRFLAFKVLLWGGDVGHRLFFYLYAFFFGLGTFIGNDPIILSGTAFLAYMTRVSKNIEHPRAWIHTQFAVANIASAILVSSNPTNLVLAGAFNIKFIVYTANMIVPVVITAILLFPFLLYIIFAHERLIPLEITIHQLPPERSSRKPVNPNIPNARGTIEEQEEEHLNDEEGRLLSLEEVMNPFLDKGGAAFGAVIMTATLVTVLALNAASQSTGEHPVFWVTLPAAFVMFCWDVAFGWINRHETREIARKGHQEIETARAERLMRDQEAGRARPLAVQDSERPDNSSSEDIQPPGSIDRKVDDQNIELSVVRPALNTQWPTIKEERPVPAQEPPNKLVEGADEEQHPQDANTGDHTAPNRTRSEVIPSAKPGSPRTLVSFVKGVYRYCQETFPTVTAVLAHLPFALVPFALSMFVLVEALVTKGWVPAFAYGWDHWVNKTGTVGAVGGMGFLSVILCNFAGTNIGTTILLSRVIQAWQEIHDRNGITISDRTFWATVYSMALGVNYGAFSTAFSASLAGLLWRDILSRKHINVRRLDFARINLPIIAIAMTVGCGVLIGEVYIMRSGSRSYSL